VPLIKKMGKSDKITKAGATELSRKLVLMKAINTVLTKEFVSKLDSYYFFKSQIKSLKKWRNFWIIFHRSP